jgi:hypothetical protein
VIIVRPLEEEEEKRPRLRKLERAKIEGHCYGHWVVQNNPNGQNEQDGETSG